jgi:hypothetical protein
VWRKKQAKNDEMCPNSKKWVNPERKAHLTNAKLSLHPPFCLFHVALSYD